MTARLALLLLALLFSACHPPNPVSDAQVAAIVARCKEMGMAARVFNGGTSIAECIEVKTK